MVRLVGAVIQKGNWFLLKVGGLLLLLKGGCAVRVCVRAGGGTGLGDLGGV